MENSRLIKMIRELAVNPYGAPGSFKYDVMELLPEELYVDRQVVELLTGMDAQPRFVSFADDCFLIHARQIIQSMVLGVIPDEPGCREKVRPLLFEDGAVSHKLSLGEKAELLPRAGVVYREYVRKVGELRRMQAEVKPEWENATRFGPQLMDCFYDHWMMDIPALHMRDLKKEVHAYQRRKL